MDGEVKVKEVPGAVNGSNGASMAGRTSGTPSRLRYLRFSDSQPYSSGTRVFCWYECECGNVTRARKDHVNSGRIRSCGCLRNEKALKNLEKAGRRYNWGNINGGGAKKGAPGKSWIKGRKAFYLEDEHPTDQRKRKKVFITMQEHLDYLCGKEPKFGNKKVG